MQNYLTKNFLSQGISRLSASLFLAATLAVLAGCGSGGAGTPPSSAAAAGAGAGAGSAAPSGTPAASIELLASSPQMPSSGANAVALTAVVLSATRQAVSGRTVTFSSATDVTAFVNNISASGVSDANGLVTAQLNLGSSKANRTIAVTATADAANASNNVAVVGTTVTISGNSSLAAGATTTLTFTVKDSAGTAIPNATVTVASQNVNTITPATGVTNSSGQFTATVKATAPGNDVITATAAGGSATQALTISSASFALGISNPGCVGMAASPPEIPLTGACNTPTVTANWTDIPSPVGQTVSFSASRGTIAGGTVTASSSTLVAPGNASVSISSTTAGPAIISASGPGSTPAATLNVIFVATNASSATVEAIPGTVQFTSGSASQTNNSSQITVQVRDLALNLVKNASVNFGLNDTTGGTLTSATGTTDVTGSASVTYIAGGISSAQNGVTVTATVTSVNGVAIVPVTGSTSLTVSRQSLQVRLGTDNLVASNAPTNTKTYVAIVTDAAGNSVVGVTVQFALRPGRYQKGTFVPDSTGTFWVKSPTVTCPNEDLNFNGILDPGEGLVAFPVGQTPALRPGAVASVNATGVTNASGIAAATITYAKSYSLWTEVTLEARTSVTSNDPPTQVTFFLPGSAPDYTPLTQAPPPIPFGIDNTCADIF